MVFKVVIELIFSPPQKSRIKQANLLVWSFVDLVIVLPWLLGTGVTTAAIEDSESEFATEVVEAVASTGDIADLGSVSKRDLLPSIDFGILPPVEEIIEGLASEDFISSIGLDGVEEFLDDVVIGTSSIE